MIKTTTNEVKFNNLLDVQQRFPDEKSCRDYLIQARWNGQMVCVHCDSTRQFYPINDGELYKCADCRKNFSIRVGTIFEDTKIPLQKWFFAIFLFSSHKKGISSAQLGRDISVRQATAWHMLHRIRYGMAPKAMRGKLKNIVEADETYVGGKHHRGKRGRGSENKTAVFGLAERQGEVRTQPVKRVNSKTLKGITRENVSSKEATLVTDDWMAYNNLSKEYKHETINHSVKEYVRGTIHTNNIENFWSLLKRGIIGIYHQVSAKHLHRYCDEFQFRYNARKIGDTNRFALALSQCEGKLMYRELIEKN